MIYVPQPPSREDIARQLLCELAVKRGATFMLAFMNRTSGIHRFSDAGRLTKEQLNHLFEEIETLHELLS